MIKFSEILVNKPIIYYIVDSQDLLTEDNIYYKGTLDKLKNDWWDKLVNDGEIGGYELISKKEWDEGVAKQNLEEITVNKPISKKDILEYLINNNLENVCAYNTFKDYKDETGAELEEELKYVKAYFSSFKPDEIFFTYMGEHESGNINLIKPYKFCWYLSDRETGKLLFHNIEGLQV